MTREEWLGSINIDSRPPTQLVVDYISEATGRAFEAKDAQLLPTSEDIANETGVNKKYVLEILREKGRVYGVRTVGAAPIRYAISVTI